MVAFVVAAWVGMKALSSWWWVFRVGEYSDTYYYFLAARDAAAALAVTRLGSATGPTRDELSAVLT